MIPRRTVLVMAVGCGLSVANLYYSQPLLVEMARDLKVPPTRMGMVSALSQVGYTLGLLLFVPLGDLLERRRFVLVMLGAVTLALLAVAAAPGPTWLAVASLAMGVATIIPQLLVPFAAGLAGPGERGKVVGTVMSGLIIGILLARTVSGVVGTHLGWRAMYGIAAVLMVALAAALRRLLPRWEPRNPGLTYPGLLRSMVVLFRAEPVLRQSCLFGAMTFGAFGAFWTTLAFFLAEPPYRYDGDEVGLFGLIGAAGALAASVAGRVADRRSPRLTIGLGLAAMLAAYALLFLVGDRLWGLVAGVLLLDVGHQAAHISNQARIFGLEAGAHSRLNTVYMASGFCGMSAGSAAATLAWGRMGWGGVCLVASTLLVVAFAGFLATAERRRASAGVLAASRR